MKTRIISCLLHPSILYVFITVASITVKANAEGVILVRKTLSQESKYWVPIGFKKIEKFPEAVSVELMNGQSRSYRYDETGAIVEVPDWNAFSALSSGDWDKLHEQRNSLNQQATQYPQIKEWIGSVVSKFDVLLSNQSADKVLFRGQMIAAEEYQKTWGGGSPTINGAGLTLTLGKKAYQNVKVSSIKEGRLRVIFDGGIASIDITELNEAQVAALKLASPDTFGVYLKKIEEDKVKGALAKASESERETQVAMQRVKVESEKAEKATSIKETGQSPTSVETENESTSQRKQPHLKEVSSALSALKKAPYRTANAKITGEVAAEESSLFKTFASNYGMTITSFKATDITESIIHGALTLLSEQGLSMENNLVARNLISTGQVGMDDFRENFESLAVTGKAEQIKLINQQVRLKLEKKGFNLLEILRNNKWLFTGFNG
jgi:hypothetical protein